MKEIKEETWLKLAGMRLGDDQEVSFLRARLPVFGCYSSAEVSGFCHF